MQKSLNIAQMPHYCKTLVRRSVLFHDDCFNILSSIENESVDLILCDLPYGTTKNKWDSILPLDKLWAEYERIISYNGAIVLFAQTPFDKVLGASKIDLLKYEYVWNKKRPTGHLNSKFAPMKQHENILVFYNKQPTYNRQMADRKKEDLRVNAVRNKNNQKTNFGYEHTGGMTMKYAADYDPTKVNPKSSSQKT